MTVKEAEKLLKIDYYVNRVDMVSESKNYFIFAIVPIGSTGELSNPLHHPTAVEKKTGRIIAFNPMRVSKDELRSIKRIR